MKIKIKYFPGATKLQKIEKGNWIDLYANEDVFIKKGDYELVPFGFALELPKGWEAHIAPRSSLFKNLGLIQTNSVGVVDDSYIGDNDEWMIPLFCLVPTYGSGFGTLVTKGSKIAQFRIIEVMPDIEFEEVEYLEGPNRGGYGTTGGYLK